MNLTGERTIPASVEKTWVALNDPQTLKACIAGCESIEATGENQYVAVMAVRIGPVNAKFKGKLQLSDIVALESYKINFEGQGGVAGFGKGSAAVTLSPAGSDGTATNLKYVADAQVGGKIAQIGSRLVESAAAKIADDFFKAFEAKMTEPLPPGATVAATGEAPGPASSAGPGMSAGMATGLSSGIDAGTTSGLASTAAPDMTSGFNADSPAGLGASGTSAAGSSTTSGSFDAPSAPRSAASSATPYRAPAAAEAGIETGMDTGMAGAGSAIPGVGAAGAAAAVQPAPVRAAPTLDHVLERDAQPRTATGRGSTVWWIAGIIILAMLAYFFTR